MDRDMMDYITDSTENDSVIIDEYVNKLVDNCCTNLDSYIKYVFDLLNREDRAIADSELDDIVLTIPSLIYFAGETQERLGIRHDVSETNRKALYNDLYLKSSGTAQCRKSEAELKTSEYDVVTIIYDRAYNLIKGKISYATELLQSAKRVLSRRITAIELSRYSDMKEG